MRSLLSGPLAILVGPALVACAAPQAASVESPQPAPTASGAQEAAQAPAAPPACTVGNRAAALPDASHAELFEQLGSELQPYERTSALWLGDQPLLINEPFDFAVAMAMEDIGPAIAAGKRKKANEAKREQLAGVQLEAELLARVAELRGCGLHAYGLLWGPSAQATLRVAVDAFELSKGNMILVRQESIEVTTKPLEGEGAWNAASLSAAFAEGLEGALERLAVPPEPDPNAQAPSDAVRVPAADLSLSTRPPADQPPMAAYVVQLTERSADLAACQKSPTRNDVPPHEVVVARVWIDAAGAVGELKLGRHTDAPEEVAACVTGILREVRVPAPPAAATFRLQMDFGGSRP